MSNIEANNDTKSRLALLLQVACEQFQVAQKLATGELQVIATSNSTSQHLSSRTSSIAQMALAKEFLFNARRAYRLVEQGKGKLNLGPVLKYGIRKSVEV